MKGVGIECNNCYAAVDVNWNGYPAVIVCLAKIDSYYCYGFFPSQKKLKNMYTTLQHVCEYKLVILVLSQVREKEGIQIRNIKDVNFANNRNLSLSLNHLYSAPNEFTSKLSDALHNSCS